MDADQKGVTGSRWRGGAVHALRLVAVGYLSAAASLLFWSHAPQLAGWEPRVVLTGSMLPAIRPGDVALIAPEDASAPAPGPGSVVLVRDPGRSSGFYLHRLMRYDGQGRLVTRGDANPSDDWPAVERSRVAGRLRLVVPTVGLPMLWLREGDWRSLGLAGGGTWTALVLAHGLLRRRA